MGQQLVRNRFKIQQKIKRRTCGFQFVCVDNQDQQTKILKLIPLETQLIPNDLDLKQLKKQQKIYAYLKHLHMFKIYTAFTAEYIYNQGRKNQITANTLHLVLQKAKGIKLSSYIGKLSNLQALIIYNQLGAVIQYLHHQQVLHRDINPDNIYMDNKKLNFTITAPQVPTKNPSHQPSARKQYISPDIFQKKQYTQRGDYWALGIVLLQVALGKRIIDIRSQSVAKFPAFDIQFPSEQLLNNIYIPELKKVIKNLLRRDKVGPKFEYVEYVFTSQQKIWIGKSIAKIKQSQELQIPIQQAHNVKYLQKVFEESLQTLFMTGINLVKINILIYPTFVNLKKLYLNKNKIQNIQDLILVKFPLLIELKLQQNAIVSIDPLQFVNFPQLKWLYLDSNKIQNLTSLVRWKFPKLTLLWLNRNRILSVSPLMKCTFPQIQYLNFQNNLIQKQVANKYKGPLQAKFPKCQICFGCNI